MPIYKVSVKWNKEKYDDVELNTDESPIMFKAQIFALTGVQPERQKVMLKGKTVGDDDWLNFSANSQLLKDGAQFLMLGSADTLPQAPKQKQVFVEDMNDFELAKALKMPAGLKNLGNTCYMNATLQCLKVVPELRQALQKFRGNALAALGPMDVDLDGDDPVLGGGLGLQQQSADAAQALSAATRDLYDSMDKSGQSEIVPLIMVNVLHTVMPQFAEKDEHGHFRQQDANEFWLELLRMFQNKLKIEDANSTNVITRYFGGKFEVTFKCKEADQESETKTQEDFLQLSCFLSQDVKYLSLGLKAKMVEEIVKNSPSLNRDAKYEKTTLIDRLPAYLTVQMVRFFFKEKDRVNAKILKDVKFPLILDVFELCSEKLREKLKAQRELVKIAEEKLIESKRKAAITKAEDNEDNMEVEKEKVYLPTSFEDDPGSNNSGYYELKAVLTHKGRSSSSGHYVAWIRRGPGPNDWLLCDDEDLKPVAEEDISRLSGGGDWHCAYLLLYGPRVLEA